MKLLITYNLKGNLLNLVLLTVICITLAWLNVERRCQIKVFIWSQDEIEKNPKHATKLCLC